MRAMLTGEHAITGHFDGMLTGTAIVPAGADAEVAGMINGTLIVEAGARVRISGMITGRIIDRGGEISGDGLVSR